MVMTTMTTKTRTYSPTPHIVNMQHRAVIGVAVPKLHLFHYISCGNLFLINTFLIYAPFSGTQLQHKTQASHIYLYQCRCTNYSGKRLHLIIATHKKSLHMFQILLWIEKYTSLPTCTQCNFYLSTLKTAPLTKKRGIGLSMHFKPLYRRNLIPPKYLVVLKSH